MRLRLVQRRDEPAIRALLAQRAATSIEDLDVMRIVRFDPRRRAVICATTAGWRTETLVGLGAIELDEPLELGAGPAGRSTSRVGEGLDELL